MTSELITFNHLRCHYSSTALGTPVTESQLGEVQMTPQTTFNAYMLHWFSFVNSDMSLKRLQQLFFKKGFSMNIAGWMAVTTAWLLIGLALKYGYGVNYQSLFPFAHGPVIMQKYRLILRYCEKWHTTIQSPGCFIYILESSNSSSITF